MEECTLRTCVDRFNNRRYLSGQLNGQLHRNNVPNNATVGQTSIGTTNLSNQMSFASGNIGGGGIGTNGNNGLNASNGMGNCISQPNGNGQQTQIVINDLNEQYDNNGFVDVAVNSLLINGGKDKGLYSPGFGGWDNDQIDLSDEFKQHYELWLQREVYNIKIDWDLLKTGYDIEIEEITNQVQNTQQILATAGCEVSNK